MINPEFSKAVEALDPKYQELMAMTPVKYGKLPRPFLVTAEIYLFSEGTRHLYVGRTNHWRRPP